MTGVRDRGATVSSLGGPAGTHVNAVEEGSVTIDLSGGMNPSSDYFLEKRPDDPQFRESASFWVSDDAGAIGLPPRASRRRPIRGTSGACR